MPVTAVDLHELEPLATYIVCLHETDKCVSGPGLWSVRQVQGLCALAEAAVGSDPQRGRYAINLCFSPVSPLTLGADVADAIVEAARLGAALTILPCPIAGATAPAPLAAALAQQTAEAFAGVVLAQAARPGTPTTYGSRLMPCDSRTGNAVLGGPELARAGQAAALLARRHGLPADLYGLTTDSPVADVQFGFERAIGALLAGLARPAFISGMGMTLSGAGASPEALVIDDEILRWVCWSLEDRPVDASALDVDEMARGTMAASGFLGLRQTRTYIHTEKVQSRLAFRGAPEDWLKNGSVLDRAREKLAEALGHEAIGLDDAFVQSAGAVLANCASQMGISDFPDIPALLAAASAGQLAAIQ